MFFSQEKEGVVKQTVEERIVSRIYGNGRGWGFSPADFADLGTRSAVDQTLNRREKEGLIRRVIRGVYDYPRHSNFLKGKSQPRRRSSCPRAGAEVRLAHSARRCDSSTLTRSLDPSSSAGCLSFGRTRSDLRYRKDITGLRAYRLKGSGVQTSREQAYRSSAQSLRRRTHLTEGHCGHSQAV